MSCSPTDTPGSEVRYTTSPFALVLITPDIYYKFPLKLTPHFLAIVFVSFGLITLPLHEKFQEWRPSIVGIKKLYALVALYVTLNVFIIVLIWWPDKTKKIPSYVAPTVGTSVLAFGVLYWAGFAGVLPALGYHIDSEPDELIDGSRVVTYKVFDFYLGLISRRGTQIDS